MGLDQTPRRSKGINIQINFYTNRKSARKALIVFCHRDRTAILQQQCNLFLAHLS